MCNGVSPTRNTPAYAGKTPLFGDFSESVRKHPRLRGEDLRARRFDLSDLETPPLTRGRPSEIPYEDGAARNTPAYAGKTESVDFLLREARKHPRLRGEDQGFESAYSD